MRTNLLRYLHGAHAVLPHFIERGGGVLINNLSFGAWVPAPFAAAYSASKFGLRGFTDALRAEFAFARGIRICDVYPSFIDTPGIQHGANYTGHKWSLCSFLTIFVTQIKRIGLNGAARSPAYR